MDECDPRLRFVGGGMFLTLDECDPRLRFVGVRGSLPWMSGSPG